MPGQGIIGRLYMHILSDHKRALHSQLDRDSPGDLISLAQTLSPAEEMATSATVPFPRLVLDLPSTKRILMNACASTLALKKIKPKTTVCVNFFREGGDHQAHQEIQRGLDARSSCDLEMCP